MRDDWVLFDFARAFVPDWLSKAINLKVLTAVALALMLLVIVLKAGA